MGTLCDGDLSRSARRVGSMGEVALFNNGASPGQVLKDVILELAGRLGGDTGLLLIQSGQKSSTSYLDPLITEGEFALPLLL